PAAPPEDDWSDVDVTAEPAALAAPVPALDLEPAPRHAAPPPAAPAPIEIAEEPASALELAPMHELVPPPAATGHQPAADGGEAVLRDALSKASREVIERVVWEVVPQLAETIIRENLERLVKSRPA
ncbi:MAG TPA: response regulator, partial [Anaeromyxobacteraceae bacterium]|nr:response regulator [Anaeromyxobacteraceae bacterium]